MRKAEAIGSAERVLGKMESADVAIEFQIPGIDDVMRAVVAVSSAKLRHAADIRRPKSPQPAAAQPAPGKLQAHAEATARLNGGDVDGCHRRLLLQLGCGHVLRISERGRHDYQCDVL